MNASDYIGASILMPIGSIHGFKDSIKLIDEMKLYEQYLIIYNFIKRIEILNETDLFLK